MYHLFLQQAVAVLTRHAICPFFNAQKHKFIFFLPLHLPFSSISLMGLFCWQLLACVEGEALKIFTDIQSLLADHRSELAHFTKELRDVSYLIRLLTDFQFILYLWSAPSLTSLLLPNRVSALAWIGRRTCPASFLGSLKSTWRKHPSCRTTRTTLMKHRSKALKNFKRLTRWFIPPLYSPLICNYVGQLVYQTNTITSCRSNQSPRNNGFWRISPAWCLNTLFGKESWWVCSSMLPLGFLSSWPVNSTMEIIMHLMCVSCRWMLD